MATRFYLGSTNTPDISPAYDANWAQTGQAIRRKLFLKQTIEATEALTTTSNITIPITTSQNILAAQFISPPIPALRFENQNWSMVIGKCAEDATTANAHLAFIIKVMSNDGTVSRGTLRSSFTTISEFALVASAATRIISAAACTACTSQAGDRIILEVGIRAAAPTVAGYGQLRFGFSATSDFALTTALTTDLNPWCEFTQNLFGQSNNNYQFAKSTPKSAGGNDGIVAFGERIR